MSVTATVSHPAFRVGGVVLAGGRSLRMGRPKAWLKVGGRTMLERVVVTVGEGLRLAAGAAKEEPPLVVVGAPGQELPPLPPAVTRVDDAVEGEGPLRGMAAGLRALAGRAEAAYVSSCDVPLLRPAFVARMVVLLGDHAIAVPLVDGRHHPLGGVYRLAVLATIDDLLARDLRRPFFLFERQATRLVTPAELHAADADLASLRNLNTPEDYERLLVEAGRRPAETRRG